MSRTEGGRRRWRWVLGAVGLAALLAVLHHRVAVAYFTLLDQAGGGQMTEPPTPLRQTLPASHADTQMWVRHALDAREAGVARLRFTPVDNAPFGREVHWSSPPAWLLRLAAVGHEAFSAASGARALEAAVTWINLVLLLVVLGGLSFAVAARAGAVAGSLVALGVVGHPRFYDGFSPGNFDHHGLVNVAIFGVVGGLAWMKAGWRTAASPGDAPRGAQAGAVVSAVAGAVGLWLNAASAIPVLAVAGAAGLVTVLWRGPRWQAQGATFDPSAWQRWGRVGAALSVVAYLIEYAPSAFGLRLEVNHPFHALAWLGAGELIGRLGAWRLASASRPFPTMAVLGSTLALAVSPLTILLGGRDVFLVADPFVGALRHHVAEGMSLPARIGQSGWIPVIPDLAGALLLCPGVLLLGRARDVRAAPLVVPLAVVAVLVIMSGLEMRWWSAASGAQLALVAVIAALAPAPRWRAALVAAIALGFAGVAAARVVRESGFNDRAAVRPADLLPPLYRHLAGVLRQDQPEGGIVLLANPNASAGIGYFGRLASLGTLYWENAAGLRAAAQIFGAERDEDAGRRLRERRITHLALLSRGNFLGESYQLLHPGAPTPAPLSTFGLRLLADDLPPPFLQPIPFRRPADLASASPVVRLYRVAFDQTDLERRLHTAVMFAAEGDAGAAGRTLEEALLRVERDQQAPLLQAAASGAYDVGADAVAVTWYRRALRQTLDPGIAVTLAWILSTSRDARVRDGQSALALLEPRRPEFATDPSAWSARSAALAETGRFADAVAAALRAVELARQGGDAAAVELLARRLEHFRRGEAWRQ